MNEQKEISGWGHYPKINVNVCEPLSEENLKLKLKETKELIPRGSGRSYGDSSISKIIFKTKNLKNMISFDRINGIITVQSGLKINELLTIILKSNWFIPVTPGTSFITLGGAIASDVHGKNHHHAGSFCEHVISMKILLGDGNTVETSRTKLPDLFHATCGGMGLTGIIIELTIKLISIKSTNIKLKTIKTNSLEETCEIFERYKSSDYSVGWIDSFASGKELGKGVISIGEHSKYGGINCQPKKIFSIPSLLSIFLSKITLNIFNKFYFFIKKNNKIENISLSSYFYPLDTIKNWNKLYGKKGFIQYQFVIPKKDGIENLKLILNKILDSNHRSFLTVIKEFGKSNENLLSFPMEGYSLALDFKVSKGLVEFLNQLDESIVKMGGKIYLSKDACMKESTFKKIYPKWREFDEVRKKYGAIDKFSSYQSKRLGLG